MNIKSLTLLVILALTGTTTYAQMASESEAEQSITAAQTLWNKTKVTGHEWNTIKPLIAQANQALKANNFTKATQLANEASAQSKLALIQAEHEKNSWVLNVPK